MQLAADGGNQPLAAPAVDAGAVAGGAAPVTPRECMCHSLTPLEDGRALLLGGRRREGICKDAFWLQLVRAGRASSLPS